MFSTNHTRGNVFNCVEFSITLDNKKKPCRRIKCILEREREREDISTKNITLLSFFIVQVYITLVIRKGEDYFSPDYFSPYSCLQPHFYLVFLKLRLGRGLLQWRSWELFLFFSLWFLFFPFLFLLIVLQEKGYWVLGVWEEERSESVVRTINAHQLPSFRLFSPFISNLFAQLFSTHWLS